MAISFEGDYTRKISDFTYKYAENIGDNIPFGAKKKLAKAVGNFIDKMAIWYELRYPNTLVNEEIPIPRFNDSTETNLFWIDFYSYEHFYQLLSSREREFLKDDRYPEELWFGDCHILLSSDGEIIEIENAESLVTKQDVPISVFYSDETIRDELVGKKFIDALKVFEGLNVAYNYAIGEKIVSDIDRKRELKKELLECVMYKIIDRGGRFVGPRRAYMFACEFGCDKAIPMTYGINYNDPNIRDFINRYIKDGGDPNKEIFIDYSNDNNRFGQTRVASSVTINQILSETANEDYYTDEENDLHVRLVKSIQKRAETTPIKKIYRNKK